MPSLRFPLLLSGCLLLALEEACHHKPGKAGHAQARYDKQGEEEDFKSKVFVHATILTASPGAPRLS
ncbi:hypothetical protein GCM10025778_24060 [Paeniglutamicibacter antarcticus]|uniref:Uncharacterized protein n=1 Tax=Paeniglutamicibacter antarcticus TaxID=494023 RepID=A0ABP9TPT7_9MICC